MTATPVVATASTNYERIIANWSSEISKQRHSIWGQKSNDKKDTYEKSYSKILEKWHKEITKSSSPRQ